MCFDRQRHVCYSKQECSIFFYTDINALECDIANWHWIVVLQKLIGINDINVYNNNIFKSAREF